MSYQLIYKKLFLPLFLFLFCFSALGSTTQAISPEQKRIYSSGIHYFDIEDEKCAAASSTNAPIGSSEIMAFAYSPINSTWGISDATVEQWFLKQTGARRAINKYGLNAGNIGEITATVKAAGVSPVFFYAYTVNEGGGAGGFINHYTSEAAGGGVGNARADAQYLAENSQKNDLIPSWVDVGKASRRAGGGTPVDFVPQEVKTAGEANFKNIPLGTIGRAYIPATAATTWEVYYPDGLKKEFNKVQNYGAPLNDTMNSIKEMGGNPSQSGSVAPNSPSTSGTSTTSNNCPSNTVLAGEGVTKAVEWAKAIAGNQGYGYDQNARTSGWQKWKEDPNCTDQCGSFDCSSFIAAAYTEAGYFATNPNFSTSNMVSFLSSNGFKKVADSDPAIDTLQPGDILIRTGHTAMYIGANQIAHASKNENGGTGGGQVGDQTGKEVTIASYHGGWNLGVWRASN